MARFERVAVTGCRKSRWHRVLGFKVSGPSLAANKRGCRDWSSFSLGPTHRFSKPNFLLCQTAITVGHPGS